jgi:hypothetical protein
MDKQLNTPVLLVIFNRPETSDVAFDAIRKVKPKKLYIAADGPRKDRPDDVERCAKARDISNRVDWPCELKTLYREENLGCRAGTTGGINWMLEQEEYGIIFDDDCIANESFFYFCEELLEKYKDNEKIMHICGTNFHQQNPSFNINESYYFSKISQNWGWATWRRAWNKYEPEIKSWPQYKGTEKFKKWIKNPLVQDYWSYVFDRRFNQELTDWDIPWTYSCMKNEGLCIVPKYNLVTNIGSGSVGTHGEKSDRMAHMPTKEIEFPLMHPETYNTNENADNYTSQYIYSIKMNPKRKTLLFLKTHFPILYKNVKLLVK